MASILSILRRFFESLDPDQTAAAPVVDALGWSIWDGTGPSPMVVWPGCSHPQASVICYTPPQIIEHANRRISDLEQH